MTLLAVDHLGKSCASKLVVASAASIPLCTRSRPTCHAANQDCVKPLIHCETCELSIYVPDPCRIRQAVRYRSRSRQKSKGTFPWVVRNSRRSKDAVPLSKESPYRTRRRVVRAARSSLKGAYVVGRAAVCSDGGEPHDRSDEPRN